jgi:NAD(P)-dependent dehydrogenase (short-subunit alcohol dehydrogenase family)
MTRTALVTGANRGLGLEVVRLLAATGIDVVLACRSHEAARQTAAEIGATGVKALALQLDVASPASIASAVEQMKLWGTNIDVLVNNAGVYHGGDSLHVPMDAVREAMEVHFFGPLALCQALVPGMVRRGYGRVVNVSSGFGALSDGLPGDAAYALSKAGLNALTIKVASEAGADVKVNAACPGWVRTRMGGEGATRSVEAGADTIVWLATLPSSGPSGEFFRDRARIPW